MSDYPKSEGGAWPHTKTNEKQPDYRGKIEITADQIRKLIEMGKAGKEPTLTLGIWNRTAKATNQPYLYISAEAYFKEDNRNEFENTDVPF